MAARTSTADPACFTIDCRIPSTPDFPLRQVGAQDQRETLKLHRGNRSCLALTGKVRLSKSGGADTHRLRLTCNISAMRG
jgi:hypothetical protein